MTKIIDMEKLTGGKVIGEVAVHAEGWSTRHSWGHTAEVFANYEPVAKCRITYYNRTWESYRFQSVIHGAIGNYVREVLGIDPFKKIGKRDSKPMKSPAAEARRLARVGAIETASEIYRRMTGFVDGTLTYESVASKPLVKAA